MRQFFCTENAQTACTEKSAKVGLWMLGVGLLYNATWGGRSEETLGYHRWLDKCPRRSGRIVLTSPATQQCECQRPGLPTTTLFSRPKFQYPYFLSRCLVLPRVFFLSNGRPFEFWNTLLMVVKLFAFPPLPLRSNWYVVVNLCQQ